MPLDKIETLLCKQLNTKEQAGTSKRNENIVTAVIASEHGYGPRYLLDGQGDKAFLRMNSNAYLGLAHHPQLIKAEAEAVEKFGCGPGAVRFISGSYQPHIALEQKLAEFHGRQSAMLFSAAYASMIAVLPQLITEQTLVVSDALNHNCIINAIRLARPAKKQVYRHLNMVELEQILQQNQGQFERVCVVSDGVFSMRGDYVDLRKITALCRQYNQAYEQGVISIVDDSHGVGAFGLSGRGTEEMTDAQADVLIATLGKAFGVNGGYVVSNKTLISYLKETAPCYIYSNPITPAEAAAALQAVRIVDSAEGKGLLVKLKHLSQQLTQGLQSLGFEVLAGEHPIVPVIIQDTQTTQALVEFLFDHQVLATGLNYPVVPEGEQEIRLQVSASHSEKDIAYVLQLFAQFADLSSTE